ncbi:hypothetical protein [Goodfellowiella coeruleoviolacea]|uniref:Uncharacterized protein n=1 Tax=Goodfellowiella coeruleoviolacea TaxID=334858 RepID=A0AAE3GIT1_9PSEU|nr:hypothetical protein [Goodfellowiella coeruleoviolacea]MCP2168084.1 hypothetical protein [Goodfellowiella coeruleoviolacea]
MLNQYCDDLIRAVADQDAAAIAEAIGPLWHATEQAGDEELSAVLARVSGAVAVVPGELGGTLAMLCGGLIERGAEPSPLAAPLAVGLARTITSATGFAAHWQAVSDDYELPGPEDGPPAFRAVMAHLVERNDALREQGRGAEALPTERIAELAEAWFTLPTWLTPATSLLQLSPAARADMAAQPQLTSAVAAAGESVPNLGFLTKLLAVLDGERLIVLHRESGRGYQLTIGGVGDNFQLHTLLAATLSGPVEAGLLAEDGVRPDPSWVASATDGPLEPAVAPIRGQFNLVAADGEWIFNEGVPADIPVLDGHRVVVLDPPTYARSWNIGRLFPMMRPSVVLDRVMPADEAAGWLARIAPPQPVGAAD